MRNIATATISNLSFTQMASSSETDNAETSSHTAISDAAPSYFDEDNISNDDNNAYIPAGVYSLPATSSCQHKQRVAHSYLEDYEEQWHGWSMATYVVDPSGLIYYQSDLETRYQFPNIARQQQVSEEIYEAAPTAQNEAVPIILGEIVELAELTESNRADTVAHIDNSMMKVPLLYIIEKSILDAALLTNLDTEHQQKQATIEQQTKRKDAEVATLQGLQQRSSNYAVIEN